jgi:hypothetical protein
MWKTVYQSVRGTSHQQSGQPCQDSSAARQAALADEIVLVLACSDGAGSAEFSDVGSRVACQTLVDLVCAEARVAGKLGTVGPDRARGWLAEVRRAIGAQADLREIDLRQLACTLLFAVVGERGAAFGQIGDGAIVVGGNESYDAVFWPQSGEYVNTTNFISNPRFATLLEFAWRDAPVDEVALFSDGLQMLSLDYRQKRVHGPFFAPLFASLRKQASAGDLMEPMRAFLESPRLAERTDDDKTLILATRLAG